MLITFWLNRINALQSGLQAIGFSKIDDQFILVSFILCMQLNTMLIINYLFINIICFDIFVVCLLIKSLFKSINLVFHIYK